MADIMGTRRERKQPAEKKVLGDYVIPKKQPAEKSIFGDFVIPKKKVKVEEPPKESIEAEIKQEDENNGSPNKSLNSFDDDQDDKSKDEEEGAWWKPTAEDGDAEYAMWYKKTYQAALKAEQEKNKSKEPKMKKKKEEPIIVDASTEAEKVAIAQKELTALMQPLSCDLCTAKMNSNHQSKIHYEGKPHKKKVALFLAERKKQLLIEVVKPAEVINISKDAEDRTKHCSLCKSWFTSPVMAESHYAGKKHKRAAFGIAIGKGNKSNDKLEKKLPTDASGRFGIGTAFAKEDEPSKDTSLEEESSPIQTIETLPKRVTSYENGQYRCDICDVITNRADQLEVHLGGSKHQKKLKSLQATNVAVSDIIVIKTKDYTKFKTPSGQYYCSYCDITLDKEVLFIQHINTKNHKFAMSLKNRTSEQEKKM